MAQGQEGQAHEAVLGICSRAVRTYAVGGTLKYQLPAAAVRLSAVFDGLAAAQRSGLTVLDWAVHSATLEDVFLQVAQQAQQADAPARPHREVRADVAGVATGDAL